MGRVRGAKIQRSQAGIGRAGENVNDSGLRWRLILAWTSCAQRSAVLKSLLLMFCR